MTNSTLNKSFIALALLISGLSFAQTAEERAEISQIYTLVDQSKMKAELDTYTNKQKFNIRKLLKNGHPQFRTTENGKIAQLSGTLITGQPIYTVSENNNDLAIATGSRYLNSGGGLGQDINGEGMTFYLWDFGHPRITHQEYTGRITIEDIGMNSSADNDHGAHVAGTLIAKGTLPNAKGIAPMGSIKAYESTDDNDEVFAEGPKGMLVSNQSYGADIVTVPDWAIGQYVSDSYNYDNWADGFSFYLPIFSAGNHGTNLTANAEPLGGDANYDQLLTRKVCKNGITVAWGKPDTSVPSGFTVSSFSAAGPTDDLRIKPDITGIGQNITSTGASSDTAYWTGSGSSIAAPSVTGNVLLLQQYHKLLKGSFMFNFHAKGLLLHTATDDVAESGPDAHSGWGLVNAKKAADVIKNDGTTSISESFTLNQGTSHSYTVVSDGTKPLLASICWSDKAELKNRYRPDEDSGGVFTSNFQKPSLNNDLEILVTSSTGAFFPWRLTSPTSNANDSSNDRDPFERVDIYNPTPGIYTITVYHKGNSLYINPRNGTRSEDYALHVTGITERLLSVNEFELSDLSIYPNPANNAVNIAFNNNKPSNDVTVTVTDILGKVVLNKVYKSGGKDFKQQINIEQLQSGIYLLAVNNGNGSLTKKLVKK